ncbi:hypothetical protein D3C83_103220 [compost metagenome]
MGSAKIGTAQGVKMEVTKKALVTTAHANGHADGSGNCVLLLGSASITLVTRTSRRSRRMPATTGVGWLRSHNAFCPSTTGISRKL